jgi:hypothetical protein
LCVFEADFVIDCNFFLPLRFFYVFLFPERWSKCWNCCVEVACDGLCEIYGGCEMFLGFFE